MLGYYDPKSKEVYICEPKIVQTSMDIASDIHIDRIEAYLILRESVRLHEHIHVLIHQRTNKTFPPEVDEPVTVFLSFLGNSFNDLLKHMQDPLSVADLSKALLRAVLSGWEVGRY